MKLAILVLYFAALAVFDVSSTKVELPCLGKLPESISKAFTDCKAPIPGRSKRKAPPATEPPMPKSYLSAAETKAGECICQKLKLINADGIDSTAVRRLMDAKENYPTGQKQVLMWKKTKECGFAASDARKEKAEEIKFFIACVEEKFRNVCA